MYVYPSIFEETSCISLLESMAAGLYCISTNYGALFETGAEFPMYIPYDSRLQKIS
jgi:glycosyltransferase involved in cell wall biosynthesis